MLRDTCQFDTCLISVLVANVMSITSCLMRLTNVGSLPLFRISKLVCAINCSRESPRELVSVLPQSVLCALASQPTKSGNPEFLAKVTMFSRSGVGGGSASSYGR